VVFCLILEVVPEDMLESHAMGLAHRIAQVLARFPQICLRTDRLSSYTQWGLELPDALKNEGREGARPLLAEARRGAAAFASGKGRGGDFSSI
jgi:hypothetical protein